MLVTGVDASCVPSRDLGQRAHHPFPRLSAGLHPAMRLPPDLSLLPAYLPFPFHSLSLLSAPLAPFQTCPLWMASLGRFLRWVTLDLVRPQDSVLPWVPHSIEKRDKEFSHRCSDSDPANLQPKKCPIHWWIHLPWSILLTHSNFSKNAQLSESMVWCWGRNPLGLF